VGLIPLKGLICRYRIGRSPEEGRLTRPALPIEKLYRFAVVRTGRISWRARVVGAG
jgi:hypothetical protein